MPITKTTSIDVVDDWQDVLAGTLAVGNAEDISGDYESMLYIELVPTDANPQSGVDVIIEVSYADDNWVELGTFKSKGSFSATTAFTADKSAGTSIVQLDNTGGFSDNGIKWFIKDAADITKSETVTTMGLITGDPILANGLKHGHLATTPCWVAIMIDEWVIALPQEASQVRVLINNTDADGDVTFTTRISKVTGI